MKKTLKVGDVYLRRNNGKATGEIVGRVVVLAVKGIKSDMEMQTKEFQKCRFAFEGADASNKSNRHVGDLFFADKTTGKADKTTALYIKRQAVADAERIKKQAAEEKAKRGKIPAKVYDSIVGHFGCQERQVLELVRNIFNEL